MTSPLLLPYFEFILHELGKFNVVYSWILSDKFSTRNDFGVNLNEATFKKKSTKAGWYFSYWFMLFLGTSRLFKVVDSFNKEKLKFVVIFFNIC